MFILIGIAIWAVGLLVSVWIFGKSKLEEEARLKPEEKSYIQQKEDEDQAAYLAEYMKKKREKEDARKIRLER